MGARNIVKKNLFWCEDCDSRIFFFSYNDKACGFDDKKCRIYKLTEYIRTFMWIFWWQYLELWRQLDPQNIFLVWETLEGQYGLDKLALKKVFLTTVFLAGGYNWEGYSVCETFPHVKKPTCGLNIDTQTRVKHKGIRILWNEIFFSWFKPIVCFYHSCVNLHWHPNVLVGLRITEQYPQNPLNIYKKFCPSYCTACFSIMYRYCHSVILLGLTSFMGDYWSC